MLSGIGEAKALRSLGIEVVENLPGVGENLQDHVLVSGVAFKYKGKVPDRPADSNAVEAEAHLWKNTKPTFSVYESTALRRCPQVIGICLKSRFYIPP
jgi:choline dehydrogenase-like flavoprotein